VISSGSRIEKGWRVQNTGSCTWDSAYALVPVEMNPNWKTTGQPMAVVGNVKPGEMYDFWVEELAPLTPMMYQAEWILQNGLGEQVGKPMRLFFEIKPLPTETVLPEVSLMASQLEILRGEDVYITWTTRRVKAAYFYPVGLSWREHPVEVNGSTVVQPERTTTYELRVVKGDDSVETRRVTIEIVPFDPPKIQSFILRPDNVIDLGQCVDILWRISGRVNTVQVLCNGVYFWESLEETGGTWDCPEESGFFTYILQVTGPGGTVDAKRVLEVR
jgi:hypothetical protein